MSDEILPEHKRWFIKAQDDELSIGVILKENGVPSTACFLAQQIAEKYLKGLAVFHRISIRKVHDLLEIETQISSIAPEIKNII